MFSLFFRLLPSLFLFAYLFNANAQQEQKENGKILTSNDHLTINILSYHNWLGLTRDINFLKKELTQMGHKVNYVDIWRDKTAPQADINLFIELGDSQLFKYAKKNYLIPNPEWCLYSNEDIAAFDLILCKTKEAERIFKELNSNTVFLSFTCEDRYDEKIEKDYHSVIHVVGASIQKGTEPLLRLWMNNPHYPPLLVVRHRGTTFSPSAENIFIEEKYLPDDHLKCLQNKKGIHICPSETEGFGYSIMEALSCGAVVITTDAPPMNEFVSDKRCLAGYRDKNSWRLATRYYVDPAILGNTITTVMNLPEEELKSIGKKNREFYLNNDKFFKKQLDDIFNVNHFNKPLNSPQTGIIVQSTQSFDPNVILKEICAHPDNYATPEGVDLQAVKNLLNRFKSNDNRTLLQDEQRKSLGIFAYKDNRLPPWDPDSVNSGIVGSEEAVIYMSQHLARLGYKVTVYANPPANSPHSEQNANPRFIPADTNDGATYDIAISWRMPWTGEELRKRGNYVYLWPHDTSQGKMTEAQIHAFDDILWLSEYQRKNWVDTDPSLAKFQNIFGNGINLDQFRPVQERANPHACIYGSNYARGLEILLDIWPKVRQRFPKATLDIYYGWSHWGLLTPKQENKMRKQIASLVSSGVKEHGLVSHRELNRAYEAASLWTYPCTLPETFCITALRAQAAGAIPVIIEGSALKETVRHGYKCYSRDEYLALLLKALEEVDRTSLEKRNRFKDFISKEFTWSAMASKWKEAFEATEAKNEKATNKTVLLAILARNKAHMLGRYLKCINNLDYNKELITVYIKTDNNIDETEAILKEWIDKYGNLYKRVIFDNVPTSDTIQTGPHDWHPRRFKVLGTIRNDSLKKTQEYNCDYYFVVDCDNFIAPCTLSDLVKKNKPIIAPLLRSIPEVGDMYANYFFKCDDAGFYQHHPNCGLITNREVVGTFKVDVVHCTYLVRADCIDKLNYQDQTDAYEFIIFSRWARNNGVDQFICNEKEYGVQIHFYDNISLEEERRRVLPLLTMP